MTRQRVRETDPGVWGNPLLPTACNCQAVAHEANCSLTLESPHHTKRLTLVEEKSLIQANLEVQGL